MIHSWSMSNFEQLGQLRNKGMKPYDHFDTWRTMHLISFHHFFRHASAWGHTTTANKQNIMMNRPEGGATGRCSIARCYRMNGLKRSNWNVSHIRKIGIHITHIQISCVQSICVIFEVAFCSYLQACEKSLESPSMFDFFLLLTINKSWLVHPLICGF